MEIPSPAAGTIVALTVQLGDKVNVGDVVGQMAGARRCRTRTRCCTYTCSTNTGPSARCCWPAAPIAVAPVAAPVAVAAAAVPTHNPGAAWHRSAQLPHASPSVRKFARELGVPLAEVKGTGHQGPHHAG